MIFRQIASIFQFNGGEILQEERVDKGHREDREWNPQGNQERNSSENRKRDSRSNRETGCLWMDQESSYSERNDGRVRKRELCSKAPNNSGVTISCDLGTEPGLRKIGKQGAKSRKRNRPFAFVR